MDENKKTNKWVKYAVTAIVCLVFFAAGALGMRAYYAGKAAGSDKNTSQSYTGMEKEGEQGAAASSQEAGTGGKEAGTGSQAAGTGQSAQGSENAGGPNAAGNGNATDIGVEKAKGVALDHAGFADSEVTFLKAEQDYEDGVLIYEIEFYSGNVEYDYEIDAASGTILSVDNDVENFTIDSGNAGYHHPEGHHADTYYGNAAGAGSAGNTGNTEGTGNTANTGNAAGLTVDEAKEIALGHAGVSASAANFEKAELDYDNGIYTYEIEFYSGNTEYEYEIDANSGTVLDYEWDTRG